MAVCDVCFRHCNISEGSLGACGARTCRDGKVYADNYGRITSLALDPIEKKPLARFCTGSKILSVGSYGCNLFCPFCQNHEISRSKGEDTDTVITPEQLADIALRYESKGNIGLAFTYNEPLIGYEFIRDTAKLTKAMGLKNVLVTNGTAELQILEEILPYIDAMNIDLKCFSDKTYREVLGGDLDSVKEFIRRSAEKCHVELTTLIVPGMNDSEEEIRELTEWIAGISDEIPYHVSRFFPRFNMCDRPATEVSKVYELADVARERLRYVYTGNC